MQDWIEECCAALALTALIGGAVAWLIIGAAVGG